MKARKDTLRLRLRQRGLVGDTIYGNQVIDRGKNPVAVAGANLVPHRLTVSSRSIFLLT